MASSSMQPDYVSYVEAHRRFLALETVVADANTTTYQHELMQSLQYMQHCLHQRQVDDVLSRNERFVELQTRQLYAFCIEYYLGMLTLQQGFCPLGNATGPQVQQQWLHPDESQKPQCSSTVDPTRRVVDRVQVLRQADVFFTEFLDRAESVGILRDKTRREQYKRLESKQFVLSRDEKIQRFRQQREMEKKLSEVQKRREEKRNNHEGGYLHEDELDDVVDFEREQLMTYIQLAVLKAMEEQASINQEKDMLETMLKMNAATDKQELFSEAHRPPPPLQGQGIEVTHINSQMEMRRDTVRSGVFKPGHRLPTMTLEEYADQEMAGAVERQKREQEVPQGPRRYDQLVEDGDEDNDVLVEEAAYKDRAWDDWKDANEKGIGNKKGSQF